ncbi:MAG: translation initiation factor IF-2 subunit alpha [Candidatus Syntropharchaeia archaeon]
MREWPEKGELVVCTVKKVKDFGAFVELDEYEGKEGLIHVSDVAPGWIKYIRDYVREDQKIVCKVLNVDPLRKHIDLSLKDVNEHQKREKIQSWKNERKALKWLEMACPKEKVKEVAKKLIDEFGALYSSFEEIASNGIEVLTRLGIERKLAERIHEVATENVKPPSVEITGFVDLTSPLPNGVEVIKRALKEAGKIKSDGAQLEITYVGAPRYRFHVIAKDYKTAENLLKKSAKKAIEIVQKSGGKGEFHRHL